MMVAQLPLGNAHLPDWEEIGEISVQKTKQNHAQYFTWKPLLETLV